MIRPSVYCFGESLQEAGITVQCDVIPHAGWSTWEAV